MFTYIIILLFGIIIGLAGTISLLWLIQIKCPQCKKLKPAPEIIFFHWKTRVISGQLCRHCQKPKPQIDIEL